MTPSTLDGSKLLAALVGGGVEFIVVGGFAVGAHGHVRATNDVDIVPSPVDENLGRLDSVLRELHAELLGAGEFDPVEAPKLSAATLAEGGNWVLATRYGRLDILQFVEPDLGYESLLPGAISDEIFGVPVRFCGFDDLIAMKRAAGRPQDELDIERLLELREPPEPPE